MHSGNLGQKDQVLAQQDVWKAQARIQKNAPPNQLVPHGRHGKKRGKAAFAKGKTHSGLPPNVINFAELADDDICAAALFQHTAIGGGRHDIVTAAGGNPGSPGLLQREVESCCHAFILLMENAQPDILFGKVV